jgi:hypothetical protein
MTREMELAHHVAASVDIETGNVCLALIDVDGVSFSCVFLAPVDAVRMAEKLVKEARTGDAIRAAGMIGKIGGNA